MPPTMTIRAELSALVDCDSGASSRHEINQDRIDFFAEATGDRQWIHVDPARAHDFQRSAVSLVAIVVQLSACPSGAGPRSGRSSSIP
jgi:acyl dehydratase